MQQNDQESYPNQTDEINLRKLFFSLVARKLLIFGFTGFVTLLAIIVSLNLTPTYKAFSSFTSPSDSSIIKINRINLILAESDKLLNPSLKSNESVEVSAGFSDLNESKEVVFTNFLTSLSSRDMQIKVFIDGGYLTAFNPQNNPIDNVDSFISQTIGSVNVNSPVITSKEQALGFFTEIPYSVSMEGVDAEVISRYLNELVATTDKIIIERSLSLIEQKIAIRLKELSLKSSALLRKSKQKRLNEVVVLTDAADLAISLGIIENNFKLVSGELLADNLTIAIGEKRTLPDWYLYGSNALLEKVQILESRASDIPYIPELVEIDNEIIKLESLIIDSTDLNSMQLSRASIAPKIPIKPNKRKIVLLAFIGSFMMSIFLALVMNALKPDEMHST